MRTHQSFSPRIASTSNLAMSMRTRVTAHACICASVSFDLFMDSNVRFFCPNQVLNRIQTS